MRRQILCDLFGSRWTSTNQTHIPSEDIPKLWQFIYMAGSQPLTDGGDPRIVFDFENRAVHLVETKFLFIDAQGRPINLEAARTDPRLTFTTHGEERLDPGQESSQALEVEFHVEALKANKLKEIRLELSYIPSPFREETVNFVVSIGSGK